MSMNKINGYRYVLLCIIVIWFPTYTYSQANVADQQFLDNSDQFSDQHGIRLRSAPNSYNVNSIDPNLTPLSIREDDDQHEDDSKDDTKNDSKVEKKKEGFSFSDMAKLSKKNGLNDS